MAHDITNLRMRTKKFALQIIKLYQQLPYAGEAQVIGKQVLRSGTSVGAQYREACRAKSPADFVNMLGGSLKELDETAYWLELLAESEIVSAANLADLQKENYELIAILSRPSIHPKEITLNKILHSSFLILHSSF